MRLIDADALFALYGNEYKSCLHVHRRERAAGFQGAVQLLYDAPTVDAIPVVKCQQCAFCDRSPCPARDPETGKTRNCIKYCSIGERKDGEK